MNIDNGKEGSDRIEGLERLARTRAPQRDLWPGIQSRLRPRRSRYALGQLALAASLVAGLAVTFTLALRDVGRGLPTYDAASIDPVGRQSFAAADLTDDSRAIVKANLNMVRQAERQLRKALREDPDSPTLRSLLASTETRQRELVAML
jgi:hypothetical protein